MHEFDKDSSFCASDENNRGKDLSIYDVVIETGKAMLLLSREMQSGIDGNLQLSTSFALSPLGKY
jgi:hypothetical protein